MQMKGPRSCPAFVASIVQQLLQFSLDCASAKFHLVARAFSSSTRQLLSRP
jgi:hypothetical protein